MSKIRNIDGTRILSHRFNVIDTCVAVVTHSQERYKDDNNTKRCTWLQICATNEQNL